MRRKPEPQNQRKEGRTLSTYICSHIHQSFLLSIGSQFLKEKLMTLYKHDCAKFVLAYFQMIVDFQKTTRNAINEPFTYHMSTINHSSLINCQTFDRSQFIINCFAPFSDFILPLALLLIPHMISLIYGRAGWL